MRKLTNFYFVIAILLFSNCDENIGEYYVDIDCANSINTICISINCYDTLNCNATNQQTLPANGFSTIEIIANVPKQIDEDKKKITFITETGSFIGTDDEQETSKNAIEGKASAFVQVGLVPGTFALTAKVSDGIQYYFATEYITLTELVDNVISFDFGGLDSSKLIANNKEILEFKVKVDGISAAGNDMTLTYNGTGNLINGTLDSSTNTTTLTQTFNSLSECEFVIELGNEAEIFYLTADFEGYKKLEILESGVAFPEELILVSEAPTITTDGGKINLTSYLSRTEGDVSKGVEIKFEAKRIIDSIEVDYGYFNPPIVKTDDDEKAIIEYISPVDTVNYETPIIITANLFGVDSIYDSINLIALPKE